MDKEKLVEEIIDEALAGAKHKIKTAILDHLTAHTEPEDEWEDGEPIYPGDYWLWADFNSFVGDQDGKDLTIGQWNGKAWVTRSDGILMDWIRVIKWKPYEEIWPSPPAHTEPEDEAQDADFAQEAQDAE